jgi:DNA helicase-2/ATP-dependent DNA helicase PcrA
LHDASLSFQGSSLLGREAARRMLRQLDGDYSVGISARVRALAEDAGWLQALPDKLGERELTRQADLARLVRLAEEFDDGSKTGAEFAAELRHRFDSGGEGVSGVHLLTYHRAKGLEFGAVFLPRLEEKELPSKLARSEADKDEERRLLYVGMTRAKRSLSVTWSKQPSQFIRELGVETGPSAAAAERAERAPKDRSPAAEALRRWRLGRARADDVPAYVIFPDRTITEIIARRPSSPAELAAIYGLGAARLERFGRDLYPAVKEALALATDQPAKPTRGLASLRQAAPEGAAAGLYHALATWRRSRAETEDVPAFHVFGNRVLDAIARTRPASHDELAAVPGVGPAKLERYGDEVLEVVAAG